MAHNDPPPRGGRGVHDEEGVCNDPDLVTLTLGHISYYSYYSHSSECVTLRRGHLTRIYLTAGPHECLRGGADATPSLPLFPTSRLRPRVAWCVTLVSALIRSSASLPHYYPLLVEHITFAPLSISIAH